MAWIRAHTLNCHTCDRVLDVSPPSSKKHVPFKSGTWARIDNVHVYSEVRMTSRSIDLKRLDDVKFITCVKV